MAILRFWPSLRAEIQKHERWVMANIDKTIFSITKWGQGDDDDDENGDTDQGRGGEGSEAGTSDI